MVPLIPLYYRLLSTRTGSNSGRTFRSFCGFREFYESVSLHRPPRTGSTGSAPRVNTSRERGAGSRLCPLDLSAGRVRRASTVEPGAVLVEESPRHFGRAPPTVSGPFLCPQPLLVSMSGTGAAPPLCPRLRTGFQGPRPGLHHSGVPGPRPGPAWLMLRAVRAAVLQCLAWCGVRERLPLRPAHRLLNTNHLR